MYDELTKLYYLNARYYNPETGVFMSQDSVRGSADDYGIWNLYAYCAGNPVCYVDPSGHNPIALAGGGLFITAAISILGAAIIVGGVCYLDSKLDNPSKREEMIDQVIQEYEKTSKKEEASKTSKKNTKNQKKTGNNKSPKKNNKINIKKILDSASKPKKGGETVAGHALQKHAGRKPNIWGRIKGNSAKINNTAMNHIKDILQGAGEFKVVESNGRRFWEKVLKDGRGIRLNMDGTFKGFIDQIR